MGPLADELSGKAVLSVAAGADVDAGRSGVAAGLAGAAGTQAGNHGLGGNGDQKGGVEVAAHCGQLGVKGHGLGGVAREAVKNKAVLGVVSLEALLDQVNDQGVRDELAGVHVALGLHAELGASLDGGTEKIAGGDVREAELGNELLSLSTLASARSAEKNNVHVASALSKTERGQADCLPALAANLLEEPVVVMHLELTL